MCFFTKGSKLRIALKDIKCYKVVRHPNNSKLYYSLMRDFPYEFNTVYKKHWWRLFLHYITKPIIEGEGYHSYTEIGCAPYPHKIVKCIIPKGSVYLHNEEDKEYCSNAIKLVSLI